MKRIDTTASRAGQLFLALIAITFISTPSIHIDGRPITAQLHGKPGIPRAWVHQAYLENRGGETLFDGKFRLFRKSGQLIDARALPLEKPADMNDPEAIAAKAKLTAVFEKITPTGPRPPEPLEFTDITPTMKPTKSR